MAKWQMMKNGEPTTAPLFDDGNPAQPGEDGFSNAAALAHAQSLGADGVNYVGVSEAQ